MDKLIISNEGYPGTTELLQFIEKSSHDQINALVKAVGNNCIISGMDVSGGDLTDGWLIYGDELLPFESSTIGATVVIVETSVTGGYDVADDGNFSTILPIWKTRKAKFGNPGDSGVVDDFAYSLLTRVNSNQNLTSVKLEGQVRVITPAADDAYGVITGGDFTSVSLTESGELSRYEITVEFPELLGNYTPIFNYSNGDGIFIGTAATVVTEKTSTSMTFFVNFTHGSASGVEYDRRIDITLIA